MTRVPRWLFLAALLGFFFPFATVSCAGQQVASIRGVQLVVGGNVGVSERFVSDLASSGAPSIDPEPWAIAAAVLLVGALLVDFLAPTRRVLVLALSGAAVFALLLLWQQISSGSGEVPGLTVSVGFGWVLTLFASFSAAGWIGYELAPSSAWNRRAARGPPREERPRPPPMGPRRSADGAASPQAVSAELDRGVSSERFCPTCGTEFHEDAAFCHVCRRRRKVLDPKIESLSARNKAPADSFREGSPSAAGSEKQKDEVTIPGSSSEAAQRVLQRAIDQRPRGAMLVLDMRWVSSGASGTSVIGEAAQAVRSGRLSRVTFKDTPTGLEDVVTAAARDQGLGTSQSPEGVTLAVEHDPPGSSKQATGPSDTKPHELSRSSNDVVQLEQGPEKAKAQSIADSRTEPSNHRTEGADDQPTGDDAEFKGAYCVNCGSELPDAVRFCVSCGTAT